MKAIKISPQWALGDTEVEDFERCFIEWEKILDKCIASNVVYFEGDRKNFAKKIIIEIFISKVWFYGSLLVYEPTHPCLYVLIMMFVTTN